MQIAVGANRLPKILDKLSPILYSITLECIGSTKRVTVARGSGMQCEKYIFYAKTCGKCGNFYLEQ
jgi:hypothetical protein